MLKDISLGFWIDPKVGRAGRLGNLYNDGSGLLLCDFLRTIGVIFYSVV